MFGKREDSKNKAMRDNEELTPWERQQLLREENIEKKQKKSKKILVSSNLVKFNGLRKKRLIRSYRQVIADLQAENMSLEKELFEEEFEDDGTEIPADLWEKL